MKLLIICLIISNSIFATIYIAAFDRTSESWGLGYSSSGANFRIRKVKDKGIIGFGSYGRCEGIDDKSLFLKNLSAKEITDSIYSTCKSKGWEKFRMTAVTSDGSLSSFIAKQGCHSTNKYCSEIVENDFVITGGGLKGGVHKKTADFYRAIKDDNISLECKLLKTLSYMYTVGGEYLNFKGAAIVVDSFKYQDLSYFWMRLDNNQREDVLLQQISYQMIHKGFRCD